MDDPVEFDDEALEQTATLQSRSGDRTKIVAGSMAVELSERRLGVPESDEDRPAHFGWRPMKGSSRRIAQSDPKPESEPVVGRTMPFTRWSQQRRQKGYPASRKS
jgi:hypothetical protein